MVYIGMQDDDLVEEYLDSSSLIVQADSLQDAINEAAALSQEGDAILFSPAAPTGDWYADYRERGETFKSLLA